MKPQLQKKKKRCSHIFLCHVTNLELNGLLVGQRGRTRTVSPRRCREFIWLVGYWKILPSCHVIMIYNRSLPKRKKSDFLVLARDSSSNLILKVCGWCRCENSCIFNSIKEQCWRPQTFIKIIKTNSKKKNTYQRRRVQLFQSRCLMWRSPLSGVEWRCRNCLLTLAKV